MNKHLEDTPTDEEIIEAEKIRENDKQEEWIEGMKPTFREFYWLIQQNKITEDIFVDDICHRFNLLRSKDRDTLIESLEKKKYTFKEVDWGDSMKSMEPVEGNGEVCLKEAEGYNRAITDLITNLSTLNE
jgi:hypothetical protein